MLRVMERLEKGLEHAIHRELIGRGCGSLHRTAPLTHEPYCRGPQAYRPSRLRLSGGPSFALRPQLPVTRF
jgi:hypothetical protein